MFRRQIQHISICTRTKGRKAQEIEYIKKTFGNVKIYSDITFDRAGVLQNQYTQNISIQKPKLSGCFLFSDTLFIRMNGDLHICCNNVNGQLVYANIRDGSFEEIFKKQNCKVVAVTDVSLANAIIENAK